MIKAFILITFSLCLSSCSGLLLSTGVDVMACERLGRRDKIIEKMGAPHSTKSVKGLVVENHFNKASTAAFVDSYQFRGALYNHTRNKNSGAMIGIGLATLGASEIIFLPTAIGEVLSDSRKHRWLHFFYSQTEDLLGYSVEPVKNNSPP
jgi:hypothetical protein